MSVLTGQTALVTGGSRGIGRAIALRLAAAEAEIILHYRSNATAAKSVAAEIGKPVKLLEADLRSAAQIDAMFERLGSSSLDILVNNAGIWGKTPLGSTSLADLEAMLDINVKGLFWMTQAALPRLREGARIVNISSTAGRVAIAGGRSLYGATKAAVDSFTRSWALELARRNIRVNAVAPGYVETDMTAEHFSDAEIREDALKRHPFGKFTDAEGIADTVLFLCSPAARWITGQSINVSGGFVV